MPIIIPKDLPAQEKLVGENIFIMDPTRASSQDIRPIEIAIVNLMPTKLETETQLLRLLGNTPLQVSITLINTATHTAKNVSEEHIFKFYRNIDAVKDMRFDGLVVTGAPVETLPFEDVDYWDELKEIMDFADKNVTSAVYICWGAQAALYHHYGIGKRDCKKKLFGVFPCHSSVRNDLLMKGMDDTFYIPTSRHTEIDVEAVRKCDKLQILAESYIDKVGPVVLKSKDNRKFFFTGHAEYDRDTLKNEYLRDLGKGLKIAPPENYFIGNGTDKINMSWKSTANLLFYNWLNYYVYQVTPYDL
ncbi:MAG: homoserine O-succinyltransferase [Clostridiaceae bacterium]|jgi:homoserine O-succinyltransferase|nr:homoserine O-succinyltransferase [Clostridiaceae bacterium]